MDIIIILFVIAIITVLLITLITTKRRYCVINRKNVYTISSKKTSGKKPIEIINEDTVIYWFDKEEEAQTQYIYLINKEKKQCTK